MGFGEMVEQLKQPAIALRQWRGRRVRRGEILQIASLGDFRQCCEVGDVLFDAFEEQVHRILDLTDLAAAAIDKLQPRIAPDIEDNDNSDGYDRHRRNGQKRPYQFLFDIHGDEPAFNRARALNDIGIHGDATDFPVVGLVRN